MPGAHASREVRAGSSGRALAAAIAKVERLCAVDAENLDGELAAPEASPGPHDATYLFEAFRRLIEGDADYLAIDVREGRRF